MSIDLNFKSLRRAPTSSAAKKSLLGDRAVSVPAYYEGQRCSGTPDHYVTRARADLLKSQGKARSINRGTAILIKRHLITVRDTVRDSIKMRWRVVGQSKRGGRPGQPSWQLI